MNFTIDQCFNFINFAARVVVIVFLIRRYVAEAMVNFLLRRKIDVEQLLLRRDAIKYQCIDAENAIRKDEEFFILMQNKFKIWNDRALELKLKQADVDEQQKKLMVLSNIRKNENIARRKLMQKEIPVIVDGVTEDLKAAFSSDVTLGKKYITSVLDGLGE